MGGLDAEELVFGAENVTSGASSDIQQATRLGEAMVTQWGMSDSIGPVFRAKKQSPRMQAAIDREVEAILNSSYQRAKAILLKHKAELDLLANALLEHETLTAAEIVDLLAPKAVSEPTAPGTGGNDEALPDSPSAGETLSSGEAACIAG